jgi:hypothetical protein
VEFRQRASRLHKKTEREAAEDQGCQMVCFLTKNPDLGKLWRVLYGKMLVYFMFIWPMLRPSEIVYGHLVYFVVVWYIFPFLVGCTVNNLATLQKTAMKAGMGQRRKNAFQMDWMSGKCVG